MTFPARLNQAIGATFGGCQSRKFRLAAIGIRRDGRIVVSRNGGTKGERTPSAHAEARLARKLDKGSIVYVARTTKIGNTVIAKPCPRCLAVLKYKAVSKVVYTINENEYGVLSY